MVEVMEKSELEVVELVPRNYQIALLEKCLKENTIIYLPTGTGKTFIALLAMKKMGSVLFGEHHKNTVVLVNTVTLVDQHTKYIRLHSIFECGGYSGEMGVDFWNADKWKKEFKEKQVLVMTSEILANIIRCNILDISRINLLIFDECHHGVNDHSMRQIMFNFQDLREPPRVIGLTATLLNRNCKPHKVMDEITALEVTFHSKIATVDGLECVVGFATNPEEHIKIYETHILSDIEIECLEFIDNMMIVIDDVKLPEDEISYRLKKTNLKPLENVDGLKNVLNLLKDLKYHIQLLGIHGGKIACISYKIQLERLKRQCDNANLGYVLSYIESVLNYIIERYENELSTCKTERERFWKYSSTKILKLIDTLNDFKRTSNETMCGLIFVERRFTAKIIYHILDSLRKSDMNYNYINPDFIVGSNKNPLNESRELLYLSKKNKEVLNSFVNKETNILCTSQVLEEGVDIPKCTFVCKFDPPKDYRSYVQSKGRARHRLSQYYIMVEKKDMAKFAGQYENYQEIEGTLNDFLIGKNDERDGPTSSDIEEMYNEVEIPPYYTKGPDSAYVNLISAIPLLCRYCQSLPGDAYTAHSPEWYLDEETYAVHIYLPIVCPLIDPIVGLSMPNKKLAKRAAAYVACIHLHKNGELDDSLMPVLRTVKEEDVSYLFEHHLEEKGKEIGAKKMRVHDIQIPLALNGKMRTAQNIYYLHILNLEPKFSVENDPNSTSLIDMYTSNLSYGFLTPNLLPQLFKFPTFITDGAVMVNVVENVQKLQLSENILNNIRKFNFIVYNDILQVLNSYLITDISERFESLLLVPVKKNNLEIDYSLLENDHMLHVKTIENLLNHTEKLNLKVDNENYLNKIVIPYYRREVKPYLVTKICFDKCPESKFPNDIHENFCDYYKEKHNVHIVNRVQPLLYVTTWSQKLNLYKPPGIEKKRKKEKIYEKIEEFLIPELLVKQEFPAELWIQSRFLPTIFSRLIYTLRVHDLWKKINTDCSFFMNTMTDMRPLKVNMNLIKYETTLNEKEEQLKNVKYHQKTEGVLALPASSKTAEYNKDFQSKILESKYPWKDLDEPIDIDRSLDVTILDIEAYQNFVSRRVTDDDKKNVHKSPHKFLPITFDRPFVEKSIRIIENNKTDYVELADIYEALTTARANDIVNMERLETLGDSFLKYITSYYISLKFPRYDEGQATQLKGRLVSNKNLFYIAKKFNIGGILKNRDLNAKEEWLPPGFCVPEILLDAIKKNTASINCLFSSEFTREERLSGDMTNVPFEEIINSVEIEKDNVYQNMEQYLKEQCLKDKTVADVIEAILGIYLEKTGIKGCTTVLHWFGIIPKSENLEVFLQKPPPNPLVKSTATLKDIEYHLPFIGEIEKIIGYTFKNKAYLLQTFTHSSYSPNRITHSYEKLEFLGDAILDFLITCFIYESCDYLTPGELTDLRSALVNNNTFGSYVVRLGLHKFLLLLNSKLQTYIDKFVEFMASKNFEINDEVLILLQEGELNLAEYVDVPKALGDIFEALAGAIFLDSGYNLDTVWKVFYRIMWKEIDNFSKNVPKNMIRKLYECPNAYPLFGEAQHTSNDRVMMKLQFFSEGRPKFVHGFGMNKMEAKKAAAKMALRYL